MKPPLPPRIAATAHEIDYRLFGDDMQFVEIELDPMEAAIAEAGAMMFMEPGIQMETIFGDGSRQPSGGLLGSLLGAGKRLITGESLFMTVFQNCGAGKQRVAFGTPYPGKIIPVHPTKTGGHERRRGIGPGRPTTSISRPRDVGPQRRTRRLA